MTKYKLFQAMIESKQQIGGITRLDFIYWAGEYRWEKREHGAPFKTSFVAAATLNEEGHPTRMKKAVVKGVRSMLPANGQINMLRHKPL